MAEACVNFVAHIWKPNVCRDCASTKENHLIGQISTPSQCLADPIENALPESKHSEQKVSKSGRTKRRDDEYRFIRLVEKSIQLLIDQSDLKDEEIRKLKSEQNKLVHYYQTLEKALADELDYRERRQLEKQHILTISQQTPSYWGPNAFTEPYREIVLSRQSKEFHMISSLINSTISLHDNQYGTVNGRDPTEFVVKQIKRIQNARLWHEYCFKKDSIIRKNNDQLSDYGSSIYLEATPILTPLLDKRANEYWLFHGSNPVNIPDLLQVGYDPRVSSLFGLFGGGFYLAENSSKSNQYIPCPGCGNNARFRRIECSCKDQDQFVFSIILYRVVLGDVHIALRYNKEKYCEGLNRNGQRIRVRRPPVKTNSLNLYDSVMGESIENGGTYMKHREFVLYDQGQAYPEYVIDFQRSANNPRASVDMKRLHEECNHFLKHTFRSAPE
ncbi:unnamed protein product [Adineta ricciae]|uniref:Poly [ADP-ribose] polymerase n=1 Tax=Adineta ricciae TaxID=249248 RepID=A0A814BWS8_ADIRI|nr:unnamed protein product [Adineta ricciae]CAF1091353.1 unnamed protein product [Adineta ricciae]